VRTSFRDPAGGVILDGTRVLRVVHPAAAADLEAFLASDLAHDLQHRGVLIRTVEASRRSENGELVLEHERVEFPSYPYEWCAEMLHRAAQTTLDLHAMLLPGGWGLKDATPHNILFRGPAPVFVDVASVERRAAGDPIWLAEAQFTRTFLLPLLAYQRLGIPPAGTLNLREGVEPETMYRWLGVWGRLRRPALSLVTVPVWLSRFGESESRYHRRVLPDAEQALFILTSGVTRVRRALQRVAPERAESAWSGYMERSGYSPEQLRVKEECVRGAVADYGARRVLDVGCNAGHFSFLCARAGAQVVGIDADAAAVGVAWRRAAEENLPVLPLVVNIADPTPARGWRNGECLSFLERSQGYFDGVFMLALLHHLLITERIPLERVVALLADVAAKFVVIEYVGPADEMFRKLLRGREALHADFGRERFEAAVRERFEVVRRVEIPGMDRAIYTLLRRGH
jgi:SAM-dependent methyltransferase